MISLRVATAGCLALGALAPPLAAQDAAGGINMQHQITAGSDLENYLRYLQVMSKTGEYPWSLRPFSVSQLEAMNSEMRDHPWRHRYQFATIARRFVEVGVISPRVNLFFNSSFPYGSNDGPVWVGKGITSQIHAGVYARVGPLTLTLAPVAFRAENVDFPGSDTLATCTFLCGVLTPTVDRPERFGGQPYSRFDMGASTLQLDVPFFSVGVSTANQWWGPSQEYPIILGNNAPGFPHIFVQTRAPTSILIGRLNARMIYGRLNQSDFSPVSGSSRYTSLSEPGTTRFATGLLAVFQPRGISGLELGAARFFHLVWPRTGLPPSYFWKPLGLLTTSNSGPQGIDENQLASLFARWMFPQSGLEVYAEYAREDNSYDNRDFVQEPDHAAGYMLGFRKAYHVSDHAFSAIRGEVVNLQTPPLDRTGRGEAGFYSHTLLQQGHTNRGQFLGADIGLSAASMLSWDRYSRSGRTTVSWERKIQGEKGTFHSTGDIDSKSIDVWHALRVERTRFFRNVDVTGGVTVVKEFNRKYGDDAWNLNATLGTQFHLPRAGTRVRASESR